MKKEKTSPYRILVRGTTDEIRELILGVSNVLYRHSNEYFEEELKGLEKIVDLDNYTFGIHNRIYYNKDTFMYVPNCSSKEGQRFHYHHFKTVFDKIYESLGGK